MTLREPCKHSAVTFTNKLPASEADSFAGPFFIWQLYNSVDEQN